jgi:hypothetical protein
MGTAYSATKFNNGVYAGAFFAVIGPGKNYQLETGTSEYYFGWTGGANSSYTSFPLTNLVQMEPAIYPARLPGVVQLNGPTNGTLATPRRVVFSCAPVLNAAKYDILVGPDAQHVTTPAWVGSTPPTNPLPNLLYGHTWWTIRATDAYGTTSWADPRYVLRDTDADGLSDEDEVLIYHTDPDNADTDGDGHTDGQEVMAGTNPLVPNFGFSISCQPQGTNALKLSWYSDVGTSNDLEFSPTLEPPSWQVIASFGPPARLIRYTNTIPTNSSGFYRVHSYPSN